MCVYFCLYFHTLIGLRWIRWLCRFSWSSGKIRFNFCCTVFCFYCYLFVWLVGRLMYRYSLSHEGRRDISFIIRRTISYFVTSERSERGTKYNNVTRAIRLISNLECRVCSLYQGVKIRLYFQIINRLNLFL